MKVLIAVPTHSETITTNTASTLLSLQIALLTAGHTSQIGFYSGSMIADLRNAIVGGFMESENDTLLMLDSDQAASADAIMGMLAFDNPLVGCFYPRRAFNWDKVGEFSTAANLRDAVYRAQAFVGDVIGETLPNGQVQFNIKDGYAEAKHVGTGCLVIRRACIEAMTAHYPELKGRGFSPGDFPLRDPEWNYGLFNAGWSDADGRVMSEDYYFCRRWRDMGGKIYANVSDSMTHVGRYAFEGRFLDFLHASFAVVRRVLPS